MPNYSSAQQANLQSVNGNDPTIFLLELTHPQLAAPVRVCNDTANVTSNGNLFLAMPFGLELPDDKPNQPPRARLVMSNAGRELMPWLEANDGGAGALVRIMSIRLSAPNNIESDMTLAAYNPRADIGAVTVDLGFGVWLDQPLVNIRYDGATAPGLFE